MSKLNSTESQTPKDPFDDNLKQLIKEAKAKNPYAIYKENLKSLYTIQQNKIKDLECQIKILETTYINQHCENCENQDYKIQALEEKLEQINVQYDILKQECEQYKKYEQELQKIKNEYKLILTHLKLSDDVITKMAPNLINQTEYFNNITEKAIINLEQKIKDIIEKSLENHRNIDFPQLEPTYADVLKKQNIPSTSDIGLIIESKDPELTTKEIESRLNETAMRNVNSITNLKTKITKLNKIIINTTTEKEKLELKNIIKSTNLNLKIEALKPRTKNIIIFNAPYLDEEISDKIIIEEYSNLTLTEFDLYHKNLLIPALGTSEYTILKYMKTRDNKHVHIALQLDFSIAKKLLEKKYIQIGFSKCNIQEYIYIPRCTRCQSYNHTKRSCQAELPYCVNCSSNHMSSNCTYNYNDPSTSRCINCRKANKTDHLNRNINHAASWGGCPIYQQLFKETKQRLKAVEPRANYTKYNKTFTTNRNKNLQHVHKTMRREDQNQMNMDNCSDGTEISTGNPDLIQAPLQSYTTEDINTRDIYTTPREPSQEQSIRLNFFSTSIQ